MEWKKLIPSLLLPLIVGGLSGFIASTIAGLGMMEWYTALNTGLLSPPSWVFGPVWTILYLMMGYSSYLVWKEQETIYTFEQAVYFAQLLLNFSWSIIFFGFQSITGGLIVIAILQLLILATMWEFDKVNEEALYWLIPYLAWVTFALFLNFQIYLLN